MKKQKLIYRGVSKRLYKKYFAEGIPKGTIFTTDPFMAKKHGEKLISVNYSKTGFAPAKDNKTFKLLKINEKYFLNKKKRKNFLLMDSFK